MKDLRFPTEEELEQLEGIREFTPEEESYFKDIIQRRDALFDKKDYLEIINFSLQELKSIGKRFGDRVAVERKLKYIIGHAYEWLGTHGLEDYYPKERAKIFENAVFWYQAADETVGFLTDYALRQAEACGGAARFRRESELEDEVTEAFAQRRTSLLSEFAGYMSGGRTTSFMITDDETLSKYLKQMADKKAEGVIETYFIKDMPKA